MAIVVNAAVAGCIGQDVKSFKEIPLQICMRINSSVNYSDNNVHARRDLMRVRNPKRAEMPFIVAYVVGARRTASKRYCSCKADANSGCCNWSS